MITQLERDCLVRARSQGGRFYPTGFDSATTEVVKRQLQRKGFLTQGPMDVPCVTDAGFAALDQARSAERGARNIKL